MRDEIFSLEELLRINAGHVVGGSTRKVSAYYGQVWALMLFLREGQEASMPRASRMCVRRWDCITRARTMVWADRRAFPDAYCSRNISARICRPWSRSIANSCAEEFSARPSPGADVNRKETAKTKRKK